MRGKKCGCSSLRNSSKPLLGYRADELIGRQTPVVFHDGAEVAARATELTRELGRAMEPGFEVFVATARLGELEARPAELVASAS